jgi:undecaprenyl-diphosphatase
MAIPLGEAIVLGVLQGVTDFLPISSEGHLALAQMLYGEHASLAFTVLVRTGTLAATIFVLRQRAWMVFTEGLRGFAAPSLWRETPRGRDAAFVATALLPTAVVGLALRRSMEVWSDNPWVIGGGFLGSAVALASLRWAPRGTHLAPNVTAALLVGLAQGTAMLPGLSRTGLTIVSLLWLGFTAERAFELSFLASIPAIAASVGLDAAKAFHGGQSAGILGIGTLLSFVVGVFALTTFRRVMGGGEGNRSNKVHWFAVYLVPLAVATLAWGYARP